MTEITLLKSATNTYPNIVAPAGLTLLLQLFQIELKSQERQHGLTFKSLPKLLFLARPLIKDAMVVKHTTLLNGWRTTKSPMRLALFIEEEVLTTARYVLQ